MASAFSSAALAGWRQRIEFSLREAKKVRGGAFVQFATVDSDGRPRCRTVVFRGFENVPANASGAMLLPPHSNASGVATAVSSSQPGSDPDVGSAEPSMVEVLKIVTDRRSEKVGHLLNSRFAELLWWFPQTNEQYRISGVCTLSGGGCPHLGDIVLNNWRSLSDATREQFFWSSPGQPYASAPYSKARKYDFNKQPKISEEAAPGNHVEKPTAETATPSAPAQQQKTEEATPKCEVEVVDAPAAKELAVPKGGRDPETGKVLPPSDNFLLLCLWPQEVKYLRLGDNFATYEKTTDAQGLQWAPPLRVNP
ncbi:unnamed protein product [Amoebophrya sp. A25]|nr:unnamed protein product [Amoebophrya sp. A25]|eukprot:GSA25T00009960001.1